jgi:hypothetical protein
MPDLAWPGYRRSPAFPQSSTAGEGMAARDDAQDRVIARANAPRLAVGAHRYNVASPNSRYRHNSGGSVLHAMPSLPQQGEN